MYIRRQHSHSPTLASPPGSPGRVPGRRRAAPAVLRLAARRGYSLAAAPPGGDGQGSWGRRPESVSPGHIHHVPLPFREVLSLALRATFSNQTRGRLCGALLQVLTVSADFRRWRAWRHRRPPGVPRVPKAGRSRAWVAGGSFRAPCPRHPVWGQLRSFGLPRLTRPGLPSVVTVPAVWAMAL